MPAGSGKRATLAMVADAAGVSLPTASKVLNGRGDVSDATRARVEEVLRDFGYVPQTGRRTVSPSRVVDLVFDDLRSPYALEILRGITEAGSEIGVDVVVGRVPVAEEAGPLTPENSWAQRLKSSGREGLIVVTSELSLAQVEGFARAGLPLVVIDPLNLPRVEVTSVGATNWSGGLAATEHLLSLGHRRIAFAGGPLPASCSQARLHGFRAALENAGYAAEPELVLHGDFQYDAGLEMATRLLSLDVPPTAIFAANDATALGVMEAARRRGLRVPQDISVVGFDDTVLAELATPALTTVRQPLQDMGRVALRTLLRLIAGETLDSHHVELATNLVVRGSTAPLADQGAR
ncbi:LacI family DNA-binding transcriptional regulator [Amycolatopsis acidiphila]|uniref:LacI family transcriptional regulator n=1 Tax=Amycolatopsis acidiphila TaxID=715473 RepID=A0A557ZSJ5_9PSEU|nr:LacI family DNA-binding transcriptional regulator [Amycolatopsis acidiphila]TVT14999.1 LacI family transcriptional regulator [Amycolatopsis acidiphila]UIJ58489.1 LacI family DNA-binding transcriptional regulator [Amycolatopsis acidiphila]GHG77216.1 LacI family transcriptional regulator [Amycolatopsis acidiphila]